MNAPSRFSYGSGPGPRRVPRTVAAFEHRARFWILIGFLVVCAFTGGASRVDVPGLVILRPLTVVALATLLLIPGGWDFKRVRVPLILLALFAVSIAIQLVPLPPGLWQILPGHRSYAEAAAALGMPPVWRPLSLTPDLTLNSLLALLPVFTVLVAIAGINEDHRRALLLVVIALACASALLGILQLSSGGRDTLYLYDITHQRSAVGFFANRNHQAALIALCFPLLRVWTLTPASDPRRAERRVWFAAGIAIFFVPVILVTGSRAGMALSLVAMLLAWTMAPMQFGGSRIPPKLAKLIKWGVPVVPVVLAVAFILSGRAQSFNRLFLLENLSAEGRMSNLPAVLRIIGDFLPLGTGHGAFDAVFRSYEPDSALNPTYFNHAHNDLLELAITGGVPALLILLALLVWWARIAWRAFVPFSVRSRTALFARGGTLTVAILLLASLVDYPLRTTLLGAIFAIACGWMTVSTRPATRRESP